MATITKMTSLDLPWHMVIDQVSHELGFAGCDIYDIIVEADVTEDHSEHDLSPEDVLVEQA